MQGIVKNKFGFCEYSFESDYVHIYNLFTMPKFRNQGKAMATLRTVINTIRKTGYKGSIQIVADPKDDFVDKNRLILFYKRMGLDVFSYYG